MSAPAIGVGDFLGRFRIESVLGSGGMGDVYRAIETRLGRAVALKILPARLMEQPDRLARFEQEARAASALNHPNIVTIYDAGSDADVPWIAMECVQGQTLRKLLRDGPLEPEQARNIATQLASALTVAHEANIFHRDLKPENVMISDRGVVKILDFGLAKLNAPSPASANDETQLLTRPGEVSGTPGYIAPEQLRGEAPDHRGDQFAFGVMLYEMAAGKNPFRRESAPQTATATLDFDPDLSVLSKGRAPIALSTVIARCLAKKPEGRYHSTRDLLADLNGTPPFQGTGGGASGGRRWRAVAVAFLATIVAIAGAALWRARPASEIQGAHIVAVRPFANMSGDSSQEQFANGISEELRGQISKISSIRLLSRTAVERYVGADSRKLASELGVNQIVDGPYESTRANCAFLSNLWMPGPTRRSGLSSTTAVLKTFSIFKATWPSELPMRCRPNLRQANAAGWASGRRKMWRRTTFIYRPGG